MTKTWFWPITDGYYWRIFRYEHGDLVYIMDKGELTVIFWYFDEGYYTEEGWGL